MAAMLRTHPTASEQQEHADSETGIGTTLEQEVPDSGADRQANHREQGELGGFGLNHDVIRTPFG
jgi:hypothetical protein